MPALMQKEPAFLTMAGPEIGAGSLTGNFLPISDQFLGSRSGGQRVASDELTPPAETPSSICRFQLHFGATLQRVGDNGLSMPFPVMMRCCGNRAHSVRPELVVATVIDLTKSSLHVTAMLLLHLRLIQDGSV